MCIRDRPYGDVRAARYAVVSVGAVSADMTHVSGKVPGPGEMAASAPVCDAEVMADAGTRIRAAWPVAERHRVER